MYVLGLLGLGGVWKCGRLMCGVEARVGRSLHSRVVETAEDDPADAFEDESAM